MAESSPRVCPPSLAWLHDNWFRRLIHPPQRILGSYIRPGDTVLDIGCGPGYFTRAMARMVGEGGKVIAIDIQEEMLRMLKERATREGLISRIQIVRASPDSLNLTGREQARFALAFWLVHEVPDKKRLFEMIAEGLVPGGKLLIAELWMHVSARDFRESCALAQGAGFRFVREPRILLSRAVVLAKGELRE